jgi:membrane-associated phospholipid phosphatase
MSKCYPQWKLEGKKCPYGTKLPMSVTKAKNTTIFNYLSIIGSYLIFISVALFYYQIWSLPIERKYKFILGFSLPIVTTTNNILKKSFLIKRPDGSCSLSCGFPSGHSTTTAYIAGISIFLSNYTNSPKSKQIHKILSYTTIALWFITILSRVGNNDHSVGQVVAGSLEGFLFAYITYAILHNFIKVKPLDTIN